MAEGITRPSFDEWALGIAQAASTRAECTRRQIGAVITDRKRRRVWVGMNGAPPGEPSCLDGACPRGRHYKAYSGYQDGNGVIDFCACHKPWPCPDSATPDSSYDTDEKTSCHATHAELASLLDAGRSNLDDQCVMYVTQKPCNACERIIKGMLKRVVWPGGELNF